MTTGTETPRPARFRAVDLATAMVVGGFVALRLASVWDRTPAVYPDSASYFRLRLWGGVRFPVVPLVYSVVGDHRAIVRVQAVTGAVAWVVAALVVAGLVRRAGVRFALVVGVLVLGLSAPVVTFDAAILSESVAVSLTVLTVAAVLRFACRPTDGSAVALLVAGAGWGLCRQNHALLLGAGAVLLAAAAASRAHRRPALRLAAVFGVLAVVGGLMAASTSQIQEYNSAQIVVRRVLADDARAAWFRDHGMPGNGAALLVPPYRNRFGDAAVELQIDRRFGPWLRDDFPRAYARYLATHPGYLLGTPFGPAGAGPAVLSGTAGYGDARAVVPDGVDWFLWPRSWAGRLAWGLVGAAVVVGVVAVAARGGRRRAAVGGGAVLALAAVNVAFVTHTAGWEYERLLLPTGVAVRLVLLWWSATLVGGVGGGSGGGSGGVADVDDVSGPPATAGSTTGSPVRGPDRSDATADRGSGTPSPGGSAGTSGGS